VRIVNLKNESAMDQFVGVKLEHESGDLIFATKLKLMITEGSNNLYGPTHLNIFFNESNSGPTPLSLVKKG
jgi:hypothetical protein